MNCLELLKLLNVYSIISVFNHVVNDAFDNLDVSWLGHYFVHLMSPRFLDILNFSVPCASHDHRLRLVVISQILPDTV